MPRQRQFCYDHPRPAVSVDIVVLRRDASEVLLIRRKNEPFAGLWALPGGFVDPDETLEQAAKRELEEETGIRAKVEQLAAFSDPDRDPRGRTISVAFVARVAASRAVSAGDDAADAAWYPTSRLPRLAFDHRKIIRKAVPR